MGWSWHGMLLGSDAILGDRKDRKQVIRKKIPGRNREQDTGAVCRLAGRLGTCETPRRGPRCWRSRVREGHWLYIYRWLRLRSVLSRRLERVLDSSGTYITQKRSVPGLVLNITLGIIIHSCSGGGSEQCKLSSSRGTRAACE